MSKTCEMRKTCEISKSEMSKTCHCVLDLSSAGASPSEFPPFFFSTNKSCFAFVVGGGEFGGP